MTDPATCEMCGGTPAKLYDVVLEMEPTDHGIKEVTEMWLCEDCAEGRIAMNQTKQAQQHLRETIVELELARDNLADTVRRIRKILDQWALEETTP